MRIVFFGPPGSGKGTQAYRISARFGLVHISTGLMFREEISSGSKLGDRIRILVDAGHLVDDETVNRELFRRLEEVPRFLLDGYPRTKSQAESLDRFLDSKNLSLTGAVFLQVPDDEVMNRLSGRLVCPKCGFTGTFTMFENGDPCTRCRTPLVERDDDRSEVIAMRLKHYHELTRPLELFYEGRLMEVNGVGTVDQITERILEALKVWA